MNRKLPLDNAPGFQLIETGSTRTRNNDKRAGDRGHDHEWKLVYRNSTVANTAHSAVTDNFILFRELIPAYSKEQRLANLSDICHVGTTNNKLQIICVAYYCIN